MSYSYKGEKAVEVLIDGEPVSLRGVNFEGATGAWIVGVVERQLLEAAGFELGDFHRLVECLSKVSLGRFLADVTWSPVLAGNNLVIRFVLSTRERDTGLKTTIAVDEAVHPHMFRELSPSNLQLEVACMVRRRVRELLTHELDEHIKVCGERAFDPHRGEQRG